MTGTTTSLPQLTTAKTADQRLESAAIFMDLAGLTHSWNHRLPQLGPPNPRRTTSPVLCFAPGVSKAVRDNREVAGTWRCPWDQQQTMKTIKPYTLEETYELLEAIDSDDNSAICEELGDVLLQVVLDSQLLPMKVDSNSPTL